MVLVINLAGKKARWNDVVIVESFAEINTAHKWLKVTIASVVKLLSEQRYIECFRPCR
jgi:hypothetical protein